MVEVQSRTSHLDFLAGGGEIGRLMRDRDWSTSPLGAPETWPPSLRSVVALILGSRYPMFVAWGEELTFLYNDGYTPILGAKHPEALGASFRVVWSENWEDVRAFVEQALDGGSTWRENQHFTLYRKGCPEDTWYTSSYSPVRDETGRVAGLFSACTETTQAMLAERRQAFRLALERQLGELADPTAMMEAATSLLGGHLAAAQVGFAEVEEDGEHILVSRHWNDGRIPPITGRWRMNAFGPQFIREMKAGETIVIPDISLDARTCAPEIIAAYDGIGTRAILDVPLVREGRMCAMLFIHHPDPRAWTSDEVALVEETCGRLWSAVERARAEAELRQSEELNRRMLASSADCIKVLGLDGSLESMSEGGARSLGFDAANPPPLGSNWPGMFEPDGREAAADAVARAAAGDTARFEALVTTRSGEVRCWDSVITPILGVDGRPEKILGMSRDVTTERAVEAALRHSETRLSAIFAKAKVGLSEVGLDGRFVRVNDELCAVLGRAREDLLSASILDVTHPDDIALSRAEFEATVQTGAPTSFDKRYLRPDESVVWANSSLTRLEDETGKPRGVLAVTVNLTERQAQEAALREETRLLETLNRTGAQLAGELDLDRLLQTVTDASVELTGAKFGAYFHNEMDETGERLHLFTLSGAEREAFLAMGRPRATAIFGPTFRNETVIRSDDILADPRYGQNAPHKGMPDGHLPVRSYLAIPVVSRTGDVLGGLIFGHPEPGRFTERHERLMQGLAGQAAVAIDNARLYGIAQSELEERRSAEARLRELNETLEERVAERTAERDRTWRVSRDLLAVVEADGSFAVVNQAWTAALGWEEHELIGATFMAFAHPDDVAPTLAKFEQTFTAPLVEPYEYRLRHKDGTYRWTSWTAAFEDRRVFANGRDVTAEKARKAELAALEAARREADALYRAYFENTAEALFVVNVLEDGSFTIEDLNPAHQSSIGLPLAEVQGKCIDEVLPPELAEPVIAHYRAAIGAEAVYQYREYFELHGRTTCWDTVLVSVRDSEGRIVRLIGSSRDLTAQMAAEEQLRQSQKMEAMGQLTGGVAHDFNNLLTPIVGSLDMLMRRGLGNEREQRLIAGAMQSAERAKTLVQRLLAFARRQPLQAAAVDLPQLVSGMAGLMGSTLGPKVDIRVELADDLPPARADANQLEMALLNLAVNARDAMPDGGVLTISAARESVHPGHRSKLRQGHYVRLSVADTGTGMDADTLARAIEPFFSTKGIGQGTGLGLSMVHGLAAQLGGGLTITSELGRGTTVQLWLPISAEPLADTDAPTPTPVKKGRGRALLVDDEELVRMSTADMLNDLGYEVIEASSAEEALRLLKQGAPPDLIVTDHLMPGMSGAELAREVRATRPGLPILIVSGYAEVEGIAPDLPRLTKPFRNAELAERLADLRVTASTSG